jgi:hypothetical protein
MYAIQGVFFQNQEWLSTAFLPGEGLSPVIKTGLIYTIYSGVISINPENPAQLVGGIIDHYGESILTDIIIVEGSSAAEISFTKKYVKRPDLIRYTFKIRDGVTWVGRFDGPKVGSGVSRCLLTLIPEDFFSPEQCVRLLGRENAHT